MSPEVRTAVIIYLVIIVYFLLQKKEWIFSENRELIPFGIGENQSIFSLPVLAVVVAIFVYYLVSVYQISLV